MGVFYEMKGCSMSKLAKIKTLIGKKDYSPFSVFVDGIQHDNAIRLTTFLTTVNYRVGELQYIKGEVSIIDDTFSCEFATSVRKGPLVQMKVQGFDDPKTIADLIHKALKKCVAELQK